MDQPTTSTIQSSNAPIAPALTSDQRAQVKQLEQPFNCPPLPLDVVYHILQLGSEVDLTAGPVPPPDQTRHRLNFLSTASLISSSWRKEAQKLMYQHVILSSRLQLKSFRALTIAIPSIASLRFGPASHGIRRVDGYDVGAILARCSGIDSLILEGVASLDTAALLADNLAGLRHLEINRSIVIPHGLVPLGRGFQAPFALDYLRFNTFLDPSTSVDLLAGIFSATKHLDCNLIRSGNEDEYWFDNEEDPHSIDIPFPSSPYPLEELTITTGDFSVEMATSFNPFFAQCYSLRKLKMDLIRPALLRAFPRSVEVFTGRDSYGYSSLVGLLEQPIPLFTDLKRLEIEASSGLVPPSLKDVCARKGITLVLGGVEV